MPSVIPIYSLSVDSDQVVRSWTKSNVVQDGGVEVTAAVFNQIIAQPGSYRFDGTTLTAFTPPPPPVQVPALVSNYQARAVLIEQGYFDKVDAALRQADMSVVQNKIALQAWDYANSFYRQSAFVTAMAGALGLSSDQVDQLFIAAAAVQ